MKISIYLDNLLEDLEGYEVVTISEILPYIRQHSYYGAITMLIRNSERSAKYFLNQCLALLEECDPIADIQLAGLLVIAIDVDSDVYADMMSSISEGAGNYRWSRGMAISYLLQKEVWREKIRKSA
jgi:hypothetical protein